MLTCIKCSKQRKEGSQEGARGTSTTKQAVKSLRAQIKDIVLKVSRNKCSRASTSGSYRGGSHRPYPGFGSSSSAPAWEEVEDDNEPNEWTSHYEPGIQITLISLPEGGNDLKRIRFSRDMFDRWKAQRWWGENMDRIMELYNVQIVNRQELDAHARSDNGGDSSYLRLGSAVKSPLMAPSAPIEYGRNFYEPSGAQGYSPHELQEMDDGRHFNAGSSAYGIGGTKGEISSVASQDEGSISISNASEVEAEWIEEDEPGVYITTIQLTDGTRELRRVRFSSEKFGKVHAKLWWEANKDRIKAQYL